VAEGSTATGRGRALVIVESPTKARTISGYLGPEYVVRSSMGHVRDLPDGASEVPARLKDKPWARLGVDVDGDFEPIYVVSASKRALVRELAGDLAGVDELYLATDEDREGEAIAWHLLNVLKPTVPVRRMVFHEITPAAIADAVTNPRDLDQNLVDAQEARRILDRLYGYEVSPVLWKKVMPRLSAGRVQSVALRLVVDKERDRIAFRTADYADLVAELDAGPGKDPATVVMRLAQVDGRRLAQGRDFDSRGNLRSGADVVPLEMVRAEHLADGLVGAKLNVIGVEAKPYRRSPYAPFRTTTLQQEAGRKLGFTAARTMQVAQRLYENGHITYMRTDSTTLSSTAISAARAQVRELYGDSYLPEKPRVYASKVKNAQEAHEAIRPAGDSFKTPAQSGLRSEEFRLYELIWMRTVASQMSDARGESLTVRVSGEATSGPEQGTKVELSTSGKTITFHGFLKAYVEGADDPDTELDSTERRLPELTVGEVLDTLTATAEAHQTRPPARYTEATLIRELEEREIGRPSTYASIIATIIDRGYVYKKGQAIVPAWLAFSVVRLLEEHFSQLVDYAFTADMEDVLDSIAAGNADRVDWLRRFYFGSGDDTSNGSRAVLPEGLHRMVTELGDIDARDLATFPLTDSINVRVGRYGPYLEDNEGKRANVPDDLPPDELTEEKALELLSRPAGEQRELGSDPASGNPLVVKEGRFGPYVTEVLGEDSNDKPRTASLFKSMDPGTMSLDEALSLLTLPRELGVLEGEPVLASNGRYGPYIRHGNESRSLTEENDLFTVTMEQAVVLLAEPKRGRNQRAASAPLRELGDDPATGAPLVVKEGRFGPYVTDGTTNATLRKDDDPMQVTLDRASELLQIRRDAGPAKKRPTKKAAAKKTGARKAGTKKTSTKKTGAKKSGAKKTTTKKTSVKKTAAKKTAAATASSNAPADGDGEG
jgi:DNA topoisomerase I